MFDIDFYQHLFLALVLFIFLWERLPSKWQRFENRKWAVSIYVMTIAILWEIAELFYNLDAYSNFMHYLRDTSFDLIAAFFACIISIVIIKKKS